MIGSQYLSQNQGIYFSHNTHDRQSLEKKRYAALSKWAEALESVHVAVVAKTASSGRGDTGLMGPEGFGLREDRWN